MARKKPADDPPAGLAKPAKPSALLDTCILKPTCPFYGLCDWHAFHCYVRVMLDQIIGENRVKAIPLP